MHEQSVGDATLHQTPQDTSMNVCSKQVQQAVMPNTVTIHLSNSSNLSTCTSEVSLVNKERDTAMMNTNISKPESYQDEIPSPLIVTSLGLIKQKNSPSLQHVKEQEKMERPDDIDAMNAFSYNDEGDKALMKIVSDEGKSHDGKPKDTSVNQRYKTEDVQMNLSDSGVGQYETIEEKSEPKESAFIDNVTSSHKNINVCGFTALQDKDSKVNGVCSSRKSERPVKLNSAFGEEDGRKIPGIGKIFSPRIVSEEERETKMSADRKRTENKPKKVDISKKSKLQVDDVYESDDGEGVESDGDLSKDLLRVRMLKCDACGKHFLDNQKLQAHKKTHSNTNQKSKSRTTASSSSFEFKKVYPCEVCGYTFRRREHWRRHKLTHIDTTPYKCQTCNRGFKRAEHVRRHQTVHTHIKAFECTLCDKKFTRSEHLKKHMLVHIGKTPFSKRKPAASASKATKD